MTVRVLPENARFQVFLVLTDDFFKSFDLGFTITRKSGTVFEAAEQSRRARIFQLYKCQFFKVQTIIRCQVALMH